ncbi:hypothetical protein O181_029322 [Austropuccinia psidii MF-1]|uniref:Uncharacterized protein n=1 Tax=Austropuccinia psidii MF-1 TaxID=1389203 RepID=A0A9Q3CTK7_9BASI|nr:hypothetical protein [Austropuccinia psidii MF-1]
MSHTYAPAPASAQAPAHAHTTAPTLATAKASTTAPEPPTRGSTYVTCKWPITLDIRPSHALPLCACVTPMHPRYCVVGSTSVTLKMTITLRQSPFMDDLGSHTPLLYIKTS